MTWTTLDPGGATIPVACALMGLTLIALAYALALLVKVFQLRAQTKDVEENREGEEP